MLRKSQQKMKLSMVPIFNLLWKWGKIHKFKNIFWSFAGTWCGVPWMRIREIILLMLLVMYFEKIFFWFFFFEYCTRLCSFLILISIFWLLRSRLDVHACYKIFFRELSIVLFLLFLIFFSYFDIWHIFFSDGSRWKNGIFQKIG